MARLCTILVLGLSAFALPALDAVGADTTFATDIQPFLTKYCGECHGGSQPEADLKLDDFGKSASVGDDRERWESILEMVRLHEMPPEGERQPDESDRKEFTGWIESQLATVDERQHRRAGRVTLRRLNRTEYNNTIRDLVGVDFQPAEVFPADDVGYGFDNIGDVLSLSPILMEKYLAVATKIVRTALDRPETRRRIITCQPSATRSPHACAREVLTRLATRAFRHQVSEQQVDRLMELVKLADEQGAEYPANLELALQAILVSPHFLFLVEPDEDPKTLGRERPLNDYELASRLSYFLWSSMPDDRLFSLAGKHQLRDPGVLEAETRRMLRDPKAMALVDSFAAQWLELRNLDRLTPDPDKYPDFDPQLRAAMLEETRQFVQSIIHEDRSILDFIDCDYTFVNQRLARHYGIPGIEGERMRRVRLADGRRGGLLTQASILTLTSNPTRTSPVKRGKWILDNILGAPPPSPPPGVTQLKEGDQVELRGSLRQRMEQHRADPSCAVCHTTMDALGFGFENFDGIGAWRDRDGQFEIDPAGKLPGNQQFLGPEQLRAILKSERKDQFTRCIAEKMLTYALGRGLESYDRVVVNEIVARVQDRGYRFSALVLAVVRSDPFRMRGSEGGGK